MTQEFDLDCFGIDWLTGQYTYKKKKKGNKFTTEDEETCEKCPDPWNCIGKCVYGLVNVKKNECMK